MVQTAANPEGLPIQVFDDMRRAITLNRSQFYRDLALMVYDSEEVEEAKLSGPGPCIHHWGIEVEDRDAYAAKIQAAGGTILSRPGEGALKFRAPDGTVAEITAAGRHITVNAFAPGPFQSRMTAFATATDEQAAKVGARVPIGRIGRPDDIAGATLYLCSRAGSYVTGAILPIDGGQSVQHGMTLFKE